MDDGARNWLVMTARNNLWRVASWHGLDDLIQDGYLCWQIVRARYPGAVDQPHIMRLFQTTYLRYLHGLSRRDEFVTVTIFDDLNIFCAQAEFDQFVVELPDGLLRALQAAEARPNEFYAPVRHRLDGTRETLNERLCRLAGVDAAKFDLHGLLISYLHRRS